MKKKRIKYWLLLLALLAINAYIFVHRNDGYKYYPYKAVSELYVTDSILYLKDLQFEGDKVELVFSTPLSAKGYAVQKDSDYTFIQTYQLPNGNKFSLSLAKGYHQYKLMPADNSQQTITLKIDHSAYNGTPQNEFLYCNLPGPQVQTSSLKTWQTDAGFSEEEKQLGLTLLQQKTNYHKDSSDLYNTLAITKFVATLCNNSKGTHAYAISALRPYGQIQEALKCNADLACGNYAAILGYLFSVAHLPNRAVTFTGHAGNWQYGVHYYNEVFLREQQQWGLVDAANKLALPFDSTTRQYLNAVSVNQLIKLNSTTGKMAYAFGKDTTSIVPYDSTNQQHVYYNQSNATISFLHGNADVTISKFRDLIQFYTFSRDYDYFSESNSNNWVKIIVKELMLFLLLSTSLLYVLFEIRKKAK